MEPNRINRQNRTNPKGQFITTFNNSGKMMKHNNEKYNAQGSLNNTASSSFSSHLTADVGDMGVIYLPRPKSS